MARCLDEARGIIPGMPVVDVVMDFTDAYCVTYTSRGMKNFWLSDDSQDQLHARTLCRECPVRVKCALYIKTAKPSFGVWAGRMFGAEKA
jgi:hypothetical protein